MNINIQSWEVTRKKTRPSFSLGALGLLFSVSDRVSGPKLSDQDRLDAAYPYRLEIMAAGLRPGRYLLIQNGRSGSAWADSLGQRLWRAETGKSGMKLVTDLTEYERVLWEEATAAGGLTLKFDLLE